MQGLSWRRIARTLFQLDRSSILKAIRRRPRPSISAFLMRFLPKRRRPFASPTSAIVWLHFRRMAVLTAFITFVILLICVGSPGRRLLHLSEFAAIFDLAPYGVLCCVAALSALRLGTTWLIGADRKFHFPRTLPIPATQAARGRLIADAIVLLPALFVAASISTAYLFTVDNGVVRELAAYGLTTGATTIREIVSWVCGVPLAFGIAAWGCLGLAYRPFRRLVTCTSVLYVTLLFAEDGHYLHYSENIPGFVAEFVVAYICITAAAACLTRQLPLRTLLLSAILWAGATLFLFPMRPFLADGTLLPVDVLDVFAAMAGVIPMHIIAAHLDANRLRHGRYQIEKAAHVTVMKRPAPWPVRWLPRAAVIAAVVFIAWFRWPAEPAAKASRAALGFPTTFAELNALSPPVPDEENAALKYLAAHDRYEEKFRTWGASLPGERTSGNARVPREIYDRLLVVGGAFVEEDKPIPAETWKWSKECWERVGRGTLDELRQIQSANPLQSRYKCDLASGMPWADDHLIEIRCLSNALSLGTIVTSTEHDSEQTVECILAMFGLAESLNTDLRCIGQLMRSRLFHVARNSLNAAMNNVAFPDGEMQRLQESIERILHNWPQRYTLDVQLHFMCIEVMEDVDSPLHLLNWFSPSWKREAEEHREERIYMNFLWDILACERFGALALVQAESHFLEWSQTTKRTGHADLRRLPALALPEVTNPYSHPPYMPVRVAEPRRLFDATCFCINNLDSTCREDCLDRTNLSLIPIALGVERFRLATGHLPERLDELVPRFLDSIPEDPWDFGHSVLYCAESDGAYAVFSVGWEDRNRPPGGLSGARFEVRNPEFRNRPQIAPADSPTDASKTSS